MGDRPHGADLLEIARETLRRDVLPLVPEEGRYAALMVANAMAIAAREAEFGARAEREALQRLKALLGDARTQELGPLNVGLVRRIREGAFAPGAPEFDAVRRHLWECALQQVRVSNPKYLERLGLK